MIHVTRTGYAFEFDVLLHEVLMDVDDTATWKNLIKLIGRQLVVARTTRNNDRFNVQIIEGVRHAVEQDTIIGHHFFRFIKLTATSLRITAAQVSWRQHRLNTTFHNIACVANPTCENKRSEPQ